MYGKHIWPFLFGLDKSITTICQLVVYIFLFCSDSDNIWALLKLQPTLYHLSLTNDTWSPQHQPNNVRAARSQICPVTASKLLAAARNLLESASSTGIQASHSSPRWAADDSRTF